MKLEQLKEILKPFIKQMIKEVILEEKGILSHIINECLLLSPQKNINNNNYNSIIERRESNVYLEDEEKQKIKQTKNKLLESIGKDAYNGVNLFEGTNPLSSGGNLGSGMTLKSPLSNVDPNDPGLPIDEIFGGSITKAWQKSMSIERKNKKVA